MHSHFKKNAASRFVAIGIGLCLCAVACGRRNETQTHRYQLRGKVVSVDKARKQVVVDHQAIPGFMDAMTMPYAVKDESMLNELAPGDQIAAELVVTGSSAWLDTIVIRSKAGEEAPPPVGKYHMPQKGEEVPDFALLNQDGRKIRLAQYRGKALLITLIYTRCPMPDFCPLMTRNFAAVERSLAADPGLYSKTHLLSVSFEPKHDTPKVLRAYAEKYVPQADQRREGSPGYRGHWEFAAPSEGDLKDVAQFFGLIYSEENGQIMHSLSTAVVAPDGRIQQWYHDNSWKPEEAVKELKDSLSNPPMSPTGK